MSDRKGSCSCFWCCGYMYKPALTGVVNSGCPMSVSKQPTIGTLFSILLTINRKKVDFPECAGPNTIATGGFFAEAASSKSKFPACKPPNRHTQACVYPAVDNRSGHTTQCSARLLNLLYDGDHILGICFLKTSNCEHLDTLRKNNVETNSMTTVQHQNQ